MERILQNEILLLIYVVMELKSVIPLICLLFAHYVGDSLLQPKWLSKDKARLWYMMLFHCFIWTGCICIVLCFFELFALWKALFLITGHWISDTLKTLKRRPSGMRKYNFVDQAWHIAQCLIVYILGSSE